MDDKLEDCLMAVNIIHPDGTRFCPILETNSGTCEDCFRYLDQGLIYREQDN